MKQTGRNSSIPKNPPISVSRSHAQLVDEVGVGLYNFLQIGPRRKRELHSVHFVVILLQDVLSQLHLLLRYLENLLVNGVSRYESVDGDLPLLSNAMAPIFCLSVHSRIEIAVVDDDCIGADQIQPQSSGPRGEKEYATVDSSIVSYLAEEEELNSFTRRCLSSAPVYASLFAVNPTCPSMRRNGMWRDSSARAMMLRIITHCEKTRIRWPSLSSRVVKSRRERSLAEALSATPVSYASSDGERSTR